LAEALIRAEERAVPGPLAAPDEGGAELLGIGGAELKPLQLTGRGITDSVCGRDFTPSEANRLQAQPRPRGMLRGTAPT
jgi:hypothetical protein